MSNKFQELVNIIANNLRSLQPMSLITRDVLNAVPTEGRNARLSIAFSLLIDRRLALFENNNTLGLQISAQTLNAVIQQGPFAGFSVAYLIAVNPEGPALLTALASAGVHINATVLNTVIQQGHFAGHSVAFELARHPEGRALIRSLANAGVQINAQTSNTVVRSWPNAGHSVDSLLKLHTTNSSMMPLYDAARAHNMNQTYGYERACIRRIPGDLMDGAVLMLDGRKRPKPDVPKH